MRNKNKMQYRRKDMGNDESDDGDGWTWFSIPFDVIVSQCVPVPQGQCARWPRKSPHLYLILYVLCPVSCVLLLVPV